MVKLNTRKHIILGSQSPRRKELLKLLELESNKKLDRNTSEYMNDLTNKIKELSKIM